MDDSPSSPAWKVPREELDPLLRGARREMLVVLAVWALGAAWTIGYAGLFGYKPVPDDPAALPLVWGMPAWVFWGVMLPWGVATLFTLWFALFFMKDEALGADAALEGWSRDPELGDPDKATKPEAGPGA